VLRCSLVTRIQRNGIAIEVSEDAAKSKDHAYCRRCEALIGQKQWMHKDKPVAPRSGGAASPTPKDGRDRLICAYSGASYKG
jgi:hypothetical protein